MSSALAKSRSLLINYFGQTSEIRGKTPAISTFFTSRQKKKKIAMFSMKKALNVPILILSGFDLQALKKVRIFTILSQLKLTLNFSGDRLVLIFSVRD